MTDIIDRLVLVENALIERSHCWTARDARREIERLLAALEEIVRESNGMNKGAVAQKIAIDALANQQITEK